MSTHIDRNQTNVSYLKNLSSGKTENDSEPQKKSALKELQAVASTLEDKSSSLKDDMEQLENLLKGSDGSKGEDRLIGRLCKKIDGQIQELQRLHDTMGASSTGTTLGATDSTEEDTSTNGPTGDDTVTVSHASITSGGQVVAGQILLELQAKYAELQALLQHILQANLANSPGVVQAMANAAKNSLEQEANNQDQEANAYLTQSLTAGAGVLSTVGIARQQHVASENTQSAINNITAHQTALRNAPRTVTGTDLPTTANTPEAHYIRQVKNNDFSAPANQGHYALIGDEHRPGIARNLNEQMTQHTNSLQSIHSSYSRYESAFNNIYQVANNSTQTFTKGKEADNTRAKGAAEAQRGISQNTQEMLNQAIAKPREDASQAAQEGKRTLDVRNAITEHNSAARA